MSHPLAGLVASVATPPLVNGTLGVVGYQRDTPITVALLDLVNGRIAQILTVSNPDMLASVTVVDPPGGAT